MPFSFLTPCVFVSYIVSLISEVAGVYPTPPRFVQILLVGSDNHDSHLSKNQWVIITGYRQNATAWAKLIFTKGLFLLVKWIDQTSHDTGFEKKLPACDR